MTMLSIKVVSALSYVRPMLIVLMLAPEVAEVGDSLRIMAKDVLKPLSCCGSTGGAKR